MVHFAENNIFCQDWTNNFFNFTVFPESMHNINSVDYFEISINGPSRHLYEDVDEAD